MSSKFGNTKKIFLLVFFLASLFSISVCAEMMDGIVLDQKGNPIPDAEILISDNGVITEITRADSFGHFEVEITEN